MAHQSQLDGGRAWHHRKPMDTRILGATLYAQLFEPEEILAMMFGDTVKRRNRNSAGWMALYTTMVSLELRKRTDITNVKRRLTSKLLKKHAQDCEPAPMPIVSESGMSGSDSDSLRSHTVTGSDDTASMEGCEPSHTADVPSLHASMVASVAQDHPTGTHSFHDAAAGMQNPSGTSHPDEQQAVAQAWDDVHEPDAASDSNDEAADEAADMDGIESESGDEQDTVEVWPDLEAASEGIYTPRLKTAIRRDCRRCFPSA